MDSELGGACGGAPTQSASGAHCPNRSSISCKIVFHENSSGIAVPLPSLDFTACQITPTAFGKTLIRISLPPLTRSLLGFF